MSRGRKPKQDAQRRGGRSPKKEPEVIEAVVVADPAAAVPLLEKPAAVAVNPVMSECWDGLVAGAPFLTMQDAPIMEAYCYWYAVFRQACESTMALDGRVATTVAKVDPETGEPDPLTSKPNPDLRTAEKATDKLRQLADALNISPTSRIRTGIMAAMAASTVEDLAKRTDEGYRQFRAAQAKGALPGA